MLFDDDCESQSESRKGGRMRGNERVDCADGEQLIRLVGDGMDAAVERLLEAKKGLLLHKLALESRPTAMYCHGPGAVGVGGGFRSCANDSLGLRRPTGLIIRELTLFLALNFFRSISLDRSVLFSRGWLDVMRYLCCLINKKNINK